MKHILSYLASFIVAFAILLSSQCEKPKEELPPETQIGANVIGFKADSKIYIARYANVNAYYSLLNFPYPGDNGYFLTISGDKPGDWGITILTDSLNVEEGYIYSLANYRDIAGTARAKFFDYKKEYYTKPYLPGELKITKLDPINKIISGTFWFDAIDTLSNTTVQIREGRFDFTVH